MPILRRIQVRCLKYCFNVVVVALVALSGCGPAAPGGKAASEVDIPATGPIAFPAPPPTPPQIEELVKQNFSAWKLTPEVAGASAAQRAMNWVQQPERDPEFEQVGKGWFIEKGVSQIALSRNGQFLVVANREGKVHVWNLNDGKQVGLFTENLPGPVTQVLISDDGKYSVIGCGTAGVVVWDIAAGKLVLQQPTQAELVGLHLSTDGKRVLAVDQNSGFLEFKLTKEGKTRPSSLSGPVEFAGIAPSGKQAVLTGSDGMIKSCRLTSAPTEQVEALSVGELADPPVALAASDRYWALAVNEKIRTQNWGGKFVWNEASPKIKAIHGLHFTTDGKRLIGWNYGSAFEFWEMDNLDVSCRAVIRNNPRLLVFSADGNRLAAVGRTDQLSVWRIKQWPEREKWRLSSLVRECLVQENYDLLEDLFKELSADSEPFRWQTETSKAGFFVSLLSKPKMPDENGDWRRQELDRWRVKNLDSVPANLAVAMYLIDQAWQARGGGFASTVTPEGWETFHTRLSEAENVLLPIVQRKAPPLEAYVQLLLIAKGNDWPEEKVAPFVEQLVERGPEYFPAHVARVEMLMPRWGGEPPDSQAHAQRVADKVGGKKGDVLYARLAMGIQPYYPANTFFEETLFDADRVFRGLEILSNQSPPDWRATNAGLLFAYGIEDKAHARPFAEILMKADRFEPIWKIGPWKSKEEHGTALVWYSYKKPQRQLEYEAAMKRKSEQPVVPSP